MSLIYKNPIFNQVDDAIWHMREENNLILFQTLNPASFEQYSSMYRQAFKREGRFLFEFKLNKLWTADALQNFAPNVVVHHCPSERPKYIEQLQAYFPKDLCLFVTLFLVDTYNYDMYRDRQICKVNCIKDIID